ncbi:hypothetical protein LBMAG56_30940 [Verrucomicrobiota bacterium]|nr:hypothetical protein LBMAG56_30940 [Verrucomicrobiota bacterium]
MGGGVRRGAALTPQLPEVKAVSDLPGAPVPCERFCGVNAALRSVPAASAPGVWTFSFGRDPRHDRSATGPRSQRVRTREGGPEISPHLGEFAAAAGGDRPRSSTNVQTPVVGTGGTRALRPLLAPAFLLDAHLPPVRLAALWQSQHPSLPKK